MLCTVVVNTNCTHGCTIGYTEIVFNYHGMNSVLCVLTQNNNGRYPNTQH